jgi:molybdopterin converting factor small subunit
MVRDAGRSGPKALVMAQVRFTSWLRELAPNGPVDVAGGTVGEALGDLWTSVPHLRGYVLDDQGRLRKHVCIFADGRRLRHDAALDHRIRPDSQLYVMQALSGG